MKLKCNKEIFQFIVLSFTIYSTSSFFLSCLLACFWNLFKKCINDVKHWDGAFYTLICNWLNILARQSGGWEFSRLFSFWNQLSFDLGSALAPSLCSLWKCRWISPLISFSQTQMQMSTGKRRRSPAEPQTHWLAWHRMLNGWHRGTESHGPWFIPESRRWGKSVSGWMNKKTCKEDRNSMESPTTRAQYWRLICLFV